MGDHTNLEISGNKTKYNKAILVQIITFLKKKWHLNLNPNLNKSGKPFYSQKENKTDVEFSFYFKDSQGRRN